MDSHKYKPLEKIILIRHGTTNITEHSLLKDDNFDASLNQQGIIEVENLVKKLRAFTDENLPLSQWHIYSSPMRRSMETAQILSHFYKTEIIPDERLQEIDKGFKHISHKKIFSNMTILEWEINYNNGDYTSRRNYVYPSGISIQNKIDSLKTMCEDFLLGKHGQYVICIGHNGSLKALLANLTGDYDSYFDNHIPRGKGLLLKKNRHGFFEKIPLT